MEHTKSVETQTTKRSPRIAVLGIGNLLLKDEGIGVHLVQKLAGNVNNTKVDLIDAGTSPELLSLLDGNIDKLIIVDAVKAGNAPGTIYRFSPDNVDVNPTPRFSLHDIGVLDNLKTMALLNRLPKSTVIIGVEPKTISFGLELSPEVEEKLPEIVSLVLKEIEETKFMEVDK